MRFAEPFTLSDNLSAEEKLEAERLMFLELTQVCLWGNSTDLSLLINMTEEQIKSLQSTGGDHLAATEKNILGNHLNELWSAVKELKTGGKKERRIDFVLDNAGFELYCDCVYGEHSNCTHTSTNPHQHDSRFSPSKWDCYHYPLPWQAVSLVRFRRHQERLGVAFEHHDVWTIVSSGF